MTAPTERSYKLVHKQITTAAHAFQLLGVHLGSTNEEIGAARRTLARYVHPDVNGMPDAEALMATVNKAHTDLTTRRSRYVLELHMHTCTACKGAGYTTRQKGFKAVVKTACATCHGAGVL